MESPTSKQEKRGPGRPRKYTGRERTSLELSASVLKRIDDLRGVESRSVFIDQLLRKALEAFFGK